MTWLWAALLALAAATVPAAHAQSVPKVFPVGEIEIGLTIISFSTVDILRIETFELDGLYAVEIALADHIGAALAQGTLGKVGYPIALNLCGRRLINSYIQHELTSSVFIVTSGDSAEIEEIAQHLRNPPCAEL